MEPFYLKIKGVLEPVIFGPAIFWLLFLAMIVIKKSPYQHKKELGLKIGFWGLFLIVLLTAPPFLEIIAYPIYRLVPVRQADGAEVIVVLGGGVKNSGMPSFASFERVHDGVRLFLEKKAPLLLLSTGYTNSGSKNSEAEAMGLVARSLGVPEERIIYENRSYNTFTNAVETKKILAEREISKIILVTSRIHMYRANKVFEAMGFYTIPALKKEVEELSFSLGWGRLRTTMSILHEYIAIAIYKFMGWL